MAEQSQEKSSFDKLIEKPRFNFWWGIAVAIAGLVGGWWLTRTTVELAYIAYPTETVAQRASNRLTVMWDGIPIQNLCITRFAVVNKSSIPLTQAHFPASDPLRITTSQPNKILEVEAIHVSRPTLKVAVEWISQPGAMFLSLTDGDALEPLDGVAYRIKFTGDCQKAEFQMVGRVVGSSEGPIKLFKASERNNSISDLAVAMLVVSFGLTGMVHFAILRAMPEKKHKISFALLGPYFKDALFAVLIFIFAMFYLTYGPKPKQQPVPATRIAWLPE
jgi:hypothetical protein